MSKPPLWSRAFALLFAANLFHSFAFHLFMHFPGSLQRAGMEETRIGWIMSAASVSALLTRPLVGSAMDRVGRRPVALLGGAVHVAACAGYLLASHHVAWLFGVRILHGTAEALLFSVMFTMGADLVPLSRRAEGIALFGLSGLLPLGLSGLVGDLMLSVGGYRDLLWLSLGATLLGALLSLWLADSRPAVTVRARGFFRSISSATLLPVWFAGLAFATAVASAFIFIKTYVLTTGVGSAGLFYGVYTASAIALRMGFAWVPERLGLTRVLKPAMLAVALGLLALAVASHAWFVAAAGVLFGVGHGFAFPILSALAVTRARESERGAAVTTFSAMFGLGALAAPGFGAIEDAAGYAAMFASASALCVLGTVGFALWDARVSGRA